MGNARVGVVQEVLDVKGTVAAESTANGRFTLKESGRNACTLTGTATGGRSDLFACFREGQRAVHRDSHVEVEKAYYEVLDEYIGQKVWVRWIASLVRVFNLRHEQIAVLARQKPGQFTRPPGTRGRAYGGPEREKTFWLKRCARIGDHCSLRASEIVALRGTTGKRFSSLLKLAVKNPV